MKRTYHAKSWNTQAKEMCDAQIKQINSGWQTIDRAIHFFSISYRPPIVRYRAAKRFGKMLRAGKIHENIELYKTHCTKEDILKDHEYNGYPIPSWLNELD